MGISEIPEREPLFSIERPWGTGWVADKPTSVVLITDPTEGPPLEERVSKILTLLDHYASVFQQEQGDSSKPTVSQAREELQTEIVLMLCEEVAMLSVLTPYLEAGLTEQSLQIANSRLKRLMGYAGYEG